MTLGKGSSTVPRSLNGGFASSTRLLDFGGGEAKDLFVNVTVENLAPCKKLMRVEIEAQKVDETFQSVTKEFQREAVLPGFRPGKAPAEMVERKYNKDIEKEVKRKLIAVPPEVSASILPLEACLDASSASPISLSFS